MILQLLFVILTFGIAVTVATQGFFSAIIMTVLTVCCAAGAVCWHEWLAVNCLAPYWRPDFSFAIALGASFGLSLLILRLVFDRLIRRQCLLASWVDRMGGGVCGFITGQIMVGIMALCVEMVPFGEGFLGYARVQIAPAGAAVGDASASRGDAPERELWLMPDRFVVAAASLVSGGVFSDHRGFFADHPDFVRALGWVNSAPLGISRFANPKSINVVGTELLTSVFCQIPGSEREHTPTTYEPLDPSGDREFRMVRVKLLAQARDERKSHLFTLRQFRLVGRSALSGLNEQYVPIALQLDDASQSDGRHVRFIKERSAKTPVLDSVFAPRDDGQVEVVFELPKGFQPSYLEYKYGARAAVGFEASAGAAAPPKEAPPPAATAEKPAEPASGRRPGGAVPDSGRGGNVRRVTTQAGKSFFGDRLPVEMKAYNRIGDTEIERKRLLGGHLVGEFDQQASGGDPPVSQFDIPEGKRLLHLNTGFLQARSGLGKALSQAIAVAQNYTVMDDRGNVYPLIGKYAIADVNGKKVVEIQYSSEDRGVIGAGLGPFTRVKDGDLKGDYQLVMLFHVNPGVKLLSFSTGGAATRRDDLTGENLTAPP